MPRAERRRWRSRGTLLLVNSVAFSPDGRRIVSGGGTNISGELKVWDAESGQETLTLKGHTTYVTSLAFSPDGRRIVSGSGDKTLKVWDASKSAPKPAADKDPNDR